ncbi:MAG: hypothetical protein QOI86_1035 [Actinomycetota bacterium]|nr:hypothetical protein [Actinomycetota bacterium]
MSTSLLTPDLRRILDDLARRLRVLEQRIGRTAPAAAPLPNHTHDGTGANSTVVAGPTDATAPVASAARTLAAGDAAVASAHDAIALGYNAQAVAIYGIALGDNSLVGGAASAALGDGATANNTSSVAIGSAATTDHDHQIMLGTVSEIVEVPKAGGLILTDNSGGRWKIQVSTGGVLSTSAA